MDMSQYAGSESKFLKADDLGGKSPTLEVESISLVEFENDDGKVVKPALKFKGAEKQLSLNATNTKKLCKKYGDSSDGWIGQKVILGTEYYSGVGKEGIVLTPLDPVSEDDPNDEIPF